MASMMDLVGRNVKIGKSTITIKDDGNKTRGIVRGVTKLGDVQPSQSLEFWHTLKKIGVYSTLGAKCFFVKDGFLYAIRSTNSDKYREAIMERDGFEDDKKVWAEQADGSNNLRQLWNVGTRKGNGIQHESSCCNLRRTDRDSSG